MNKLIYQEPLLEEIEIAVECGFAASGETGGGEVVNPDKPEEAW